MLESCRLDDLARRFGTPLYVYSQAAIRDAVQAYQAALSAQPHLLCYAVKANSNLAILKLMSDLGCGFDIVSGGELDRVLAAGASAQRVVFFRGLGRSYLLVGTPALVVALGTGAALVERHAWDGLLVATAVVAAALVVSLVIGVAQARRMSRLRAAALCAEEGGAVVSRVRHGARAAALLRATIGALSLVLIALGALLAT